MSRSASRSDDHRSPPARPPYPGCQTRLDREHQRWGRRRQRDPRSPVRRTARLNFNEIYGLVNGAAVELSVVAADTTDYKALIAASPEKAERLALARRLSAHRLAKGVVPSLDACFASLELVPRARQPAVEAALA
jgi:hypothetical protein